MEAREPPSLGALSVTVVVALNVVFLRNRIAACSLPNCARCSNRRQAKADLLQKLNRYSGDWKWRLSELINSMDRSTDLLQDIYRISGYKDTIEQCTNIWILPGLRQSAFWTKHDHPEIDTVFTALEDVTLQENLLREYRTVSMLDAPFWHVNQTLAGQWSVFYLYNQGRKIETNCQHCPIATKTVENLPGFLEGNLFCFAMFSVLQSGSAIEPHTGPCNYRLRCHLPLHSPPGFFLQVGRTSHEWETNRVVVFDDSLVHCVWHSPPPESEQRHCVSLSHSCRVVLIIDIWHPEVDHLERKALNGMFPTPSSTV